MLYRAHLLISASPERTLSRMLYREEPGLVRATYIRGRQCFAAEA